jgi:hypothetical protein
MRRSAGWVVLAAVLASVAGAAEPAIDKFVSYDTGDFVVVTSRGGANARQVIGDLAKFRAMLEMLLGRRATNTAIPTQIVIVSDADWRNYLEPGRGISGWFQRGQFANYLAIDGSADLDTAVSVVFHEYTHYYLASQFAGEYPPWFNEGLAEVMAYTKFNSKGRGVMQIPMARVYEARGSDWIPFERLLKVSHDSPEYISHRLANSFYAQAWLTVHYGLIGNPEFGEKMFAYLTELNTLHPVDEAAAQTFGDLSAADQRLRNYAHDIHMKSGAVQLTSLPQVTLPAPQPLNRADAIAVFVNVMLETRAAPERVRPLVDSLLRLEPGSARPHILASRLALETNDGATYVKETQAAEAAMAPGDWRQRRDLGNVLLASAIGFFASSDRAENQSQRDLTRAFEWSAEALVHNSTDIQLLWQFGTAATRLDRNLDLAEQALVRAYKRAPSNASIAASLAELKRQQDDIEGMLPFLEDTVRFATDLEMRRWASTTLQQMRDYLVEKKRIDAENRAQHEAYEKRLAEWEKKYGKGRKKKTSEARQTAPQ